MDTDRSEEQHDAGAGTFSGRSEGRQSTTANNPHEADMWQHLAESLLMAYDQPQPVDQSAATPADNMARADVRAWAEYKAEPDADDAVIYRPTRTLLALLKIREVWKARRSANSV
eukprot:jgi/Tetstr1/457672/TSEL_044219.t1